MAFRGRLGSAGFGWSGFLDQVFNALGSLGESPCCLCEEPIPREWWSEKLREDHRQRSRRKRALIEDRDAESDLSEGQPDFASRQHPQIDDGLAIPSHQVDSLAKSLPITSASIKKLPAIRFRNSTRWNGRTDHGVPGTDRMKLMGVRDRGGSRVDAGGHGSGHYSTKQVDLNSIALQIRRGSRAPSDTCNHLSRSCRDCGMTCKIRIV